MVNYYTEKRRQTEEKLAPDRASLIGDAKRDLARFVMSLSQPELVTFLEGCSIRFWSSGRQDREESPLHNTPMPNPPVDRDLGRLPEDDPMSFYPPIYREYDTGHYEAYFQKPTQGYIAQTNKLNITGKTCPDLGMNKNIYRYGERNRTGTTNHEYYGRHYEIIDEETYDTHVRKGATDMLNSYTYRVIRGNPIQSTFTYNNITVSTGINCSTSGNDSPFTCNDRSNYVYFTSLDSITPNKNCRGYDLSCNTLPGHMFNCDFLSSRTPCTNNLQNSCRIGQQILSLKTNYLITPRQCNEVGEDFFDISDPSLTPPRELEGSPTLKEKEDFAHVRVNNTNYNRSYCSWFLEKDGKWLVPIPGIFNMSQLVMDLNVDGARPWDYNGTLHLSRWADYIDIVELTDVAREMFLSKYPRYKMACCVPNIFRRDRDQRTVGILCGDKYEYDNVVRPGNELTTCDVVAENYCRDHIDDPMCGCSPDFDLSPHEWQNDALESLEGQGLISRRDCLVPQCNDALAYKSMNIRRGMGAENSSCPNICLQVRNIIATDGAIVIEEGDMNQTCGGAPLFPEVCVTNPCGENQTCRPCVGDNNPADCYRCICRAPYTGERCESVDCNVAGVCGEHGDCFNGQCICRDGYEGPLCDSAACIGVECDGLNEMCRGGECVCQPGWVRGDDGVCDIIDPCAGVSCPSNSTCVNGECVCNDGYEQQGRLCVKIDDDDDTPPPPPGKSNTTMYIVIALIMLAILAFFLRKKLF